MKEGLKTVTKWLNRFSGWLLLAAVVWLCWGVARIIWLILAPPQTPNLPLAEVQPQNGVVVNAGTALSIFESAEQTPVTPQKPAPQVSLKGIMLASTNDMSSAVLDVNGQVANYRVGKELQDSGYHLLEVSWDEVVIADGNNNQILLKMPERMSLDQGNIAANTTSGEISNRRLPNQQAFDEGDAYDAQMLSAQMALDAAQDEPETPEAAIDQAIDELKQNPASYLSRMGVMATGEAYQVTDAMPSELKNRLGLEAGDKVLTVNGQNVGSNPTGDADLLQQIKQLGEAQIQVQRGDQVITIRQQF